MNLLFWIAMLFVATSTEAAERAEVPEAAPAVETLEGCELMSWHRQAAGLPEIFDAIGEAESGCRNDITNRYGRQCCHGYFQIHQLWLADPGVQSCGAFTVADLRSATAESRDVNACAARRILDVQGITAWQVCTNGMVDCGDRISNVATTTTTLVVTPDPPCVGPVCDGRTIEADGPAFVEEGAKRVRVP